MFMFFLYFSSVKQVQLCQGSGQVPFYINQRKPLLLNKSQSDIYFCYKYANSNWDEKTAAKYDFNFNFNSNPYDSQLTAMRSNNIFFLEKMLFIYTMFCVFVLGVNLLLK